MPDRLSIEVPADASHLATVRLFASSIARQFGADEDTVGDLKVAVSEACAAFLRGQQEEGTVRVEIESVDGRLDVGVTSAQLSLTVPPQAMAAVDTPTPSQVAAELGLELIRSLFKDAEVASDGDPAIRFSVSLGR
jgi:anti-sigma regulatory factor (Ser/Thr protein kinase)